MKKEWLCDDCYKQRCSDLNVREIEQYTDVNNFEQICPSCKTKIGTHHLDKYKLCLYCKFWVFDFINTWSGPHGECQKITNASQDKEIAWVKESTLITKPNFGCNLFEDKS